MPSQPPLLPDCQQFLVRHELHRPQHPLSQHEGIQTASSGKRITGYMRSASRPPIQHVSTACDTIYQMLLLAAQVVPMALIPHRVGAQDQSMVKGQISNYENPGGALFVHRHNDESSNIAERLHSPNP